MWNSDTGLVLGTNSTTPDVAMAKQAVKKAAAHSSRRQLIISRGDNGYVRRGGPGRIKESDEVSCSLSQDRRRKKKAAGGDRKSASRRSRKASRAGR